MRNVWRNVWFALALCLAGFWSHAQASAQGAEDRLGVPGPIAFGETPHELAWSAAPSPGYFKQEYLPQGETLDAYRSMVLVEFLQGTAKPADLARSQMEMLSARKASDPMVQSQVLLNDQSGEIILDFLVSGSDAAGTPIAEWNGYRYLAGRNESGKPGGWLLGISRRAYGSDDIARFLRELRARKAADIKTLAAMPLPFR